MSRLLASSCRVHSSVAAAQGSAEAFAVRAWPFNISCIPRPRRMRRAGRSGRHLDALAGLAHQAGVRIQLARGHTHMRLRLHLRASQPAFMGRSRRACSL